MKARKIIMLAIGIIIIGSFILSIISLVMLFNMLE